MHTPRRGFTIVEVLVVIGVIALLVGLLAYGIQTAIRSARKTTEMNGLRQVGLAWAQYSVNYDERLLPGYLDDAVQQAWRTRYRNTRGETLAAEFCRTYPWRLLPFLSYEFETLYGYLERDDPDWNADAGIVADAPAFGLNAYYVGGWWRDLASGDPALPPTPRPVFANGRYTAPGPEGSPVEIVGGLVAQSQAGIRHPTELIVFASSAYREPGFYRDRIQTYQPGAAWVVPPRLAEQQVWETSYGQPIQGVNLSGTLANAMAMGMAVFATEAVPISRHTTSTATVRADLSTNAYGLNELMEMNRWIDVGGEGVGSSTQFTHTTD
jgi:prepilin-type N-terminal cleavage/methylation domain-containing protein